jgi:hypothetical protein
LKYNSYHPPTDTPTHTSSLILKLVGIGVPRSVRCWPKRDRPANPWLRLLRLAPPKSRLPLPEIATAS